MLIPLLLAHKLQDRPSLLLGLLAALLFSLCASAVYVLNDLLDLESDRRHPHKRQRPFASGALPVSLGIGLIPLLSAAAFVPAILLLPRAFTMMLAAYALLTTVYSLVLKRMVMLDVLTLASLYVLRIVAGGAATATLVSPWLLAFSMFFFLSLAFIKRYSEIRDAGSDEALDGRGRGYRFGDAPLILSLGPASGYMSVLVLALYINSGSVSVLYRQPAALWLLGPCLLYWLTRMWFVAHRGEMHTDPVIFALKDPAGYVTLAAMAAVVVYAI